ncbi:transcription repressor NadR [Thalassobacillus sp. CUG 92003]|uniref:transcription repressor NadR n=1 Tax=Thalassobacillus sp. CUG 92003 TaxID=2736641 RepID=UPI0015E7D44A|nr:transcription repressor NadR [Thalassobacillus sp. CUG 92003]
MTQPSKKRNAEERRDQILTLLTESTSPITGSDLAEKMGVTRQVIVGDISLLKAKNEPIVATSQGYLYMTDTKRSPAYKQKVAVKHTPGQTEVELNTIVDFGVSVEDVVVEHPVYGDLTASLMISNRRDVKKFIEKVQATNASFLLELTDGIHTHTLSADSETALQEAVDALEKEGLMYHA